MHAAILQQQQQQLVSSQLNPASFEPSVRPEILSSSSSSPCKAPGSSVRVGMTKHPRDGGDSVTLSLSLSLGGAGMPERAKKQHRRADGEFVCKTCSRAFATFQALGGHRTSHLRGRHGLALGLAAKQAAAATTKAEKPAAATTHECHFCGAEFEMGQALGGHMRRHREEAAATAQAPPVLLQLFV